MKNNKGYYSWIHSLNQAALQSHAKGKEMLAEQKGLLKEERGPDFKEMAKEFEGAPVNVHPDYPEEKNMSPAEIYAKIKAEKIARGEGRNLKRTRGANVDVKPVGDANDVERDAEDGEMGDDVLDTSIVDPSLVKRNVYDLAAQARAEDHYDEEPPPRFIEVARPDGKIGYESMDESLSHKIKRILGEEKNREPKNQKGTMRTGPSAESAGFLGQVPVDIMNKLHPLKREDKDIISHLIKVIENPEDHPPHHYAYANDIFSAIKTLDI